MTEKPDNFLLCAYWGQQSIPSIEVCCVKCSAELASAADSALTRQSMNLQPICPECFLKSEDHGIEGAFLPGGKFARIPKQDAPPFVIDWARKMVERRKPKVN